MKIEKLEKTMDRFIETASDKEIEALLKEVFR